MKEILITCAHCRHQEKVTPECQYTRHRFTCPICKEQTMLKMICDDQFQTMKYSYYLEIQELKERIQKEEECSFENNTHLCSMRLGTYESNGEIKFGQLKGRTIIVNCDNCGIRFNYEKNRVYPGDGHHTTQCPYCKKLFGYHVRDDEPVDVLLV